MSYSSKKKPTLISHLQTFIPDRKAVAMHLPLASTRSTPQEEEKLLTMLEEFALKFKL